MRNTFDDIRDMVLHVDHLKDVQYSMENAAADDAFSILFSYNPMFDNRISPNTKVLFKQAFEKFVKESKDLLDFEIGENMKKLDTVNSEKEIDKNG